MATLYVTFTAVMGGGAPAYAPVSNASQKITTSASSQQATYAATGSEYLSLSVTGGDVAIAIGPNPTAVSGATGGHFLMDGGTKEFGPLKVGDKIAVIDA